MKQFALDIKKFLERLDSIATGESKATDIFVNTPKIDVRIIPDNIYVEVPYSAFEDAYVKNKAKNLPNDYVVFDTETTGLTISIDRIIEISAIKYIDGNQVETFSQLINPRMEISEFITELTGITNKELKWQQPIEKVLPSFFEFIGDFPLVAHNTPYDIKMIAAECYRCDIPMCQNKLIDTVPLAKRMIQKPDIPNYKLSTLKNFFGLKMRSHRALEDCIVCNFVYQNYLKFEKQEWINKHLVSIKSGDRTNVYVYDNDTGELIR